MNSEFNKNKESLDQSQTKQILDEISIAVQKTYYSGYPSRTTIELFFPRGISEIKAYAGDNNKHALIFNFPIGGADNELVQIFPFAINSSLIPTSGKHIILIKVEENDVVNITEFQ